MGKNELDWCLQTPRAEVFVRELIAKYPEDVDWYNVSKYQTLSEGFIREFSDKVNWAKICKHQRLSESFIREFAHKVNWICVSAYQILSEKFIVEFSDRVDWHYILDVENPNRESLSPAFIKEFSNKIQAA